MQFVTHALNICCGAHAMLAQGPYKAWPRRLAAIVAIGHTPHRTWHFLWFDPLSVPSVGQLEICAVHFILPIPSMFIRGHVLCLHRALGWCDHAALLQ